MLPLIEVAKTTNKVSLNDLVSGVYVVVDHDSKQEILYRKKIIIAR